MGMFVGTLEFMMTGGAMGKAESRPPLTHGHILRFYYPLALSWLFMSIESPISVGIIARLPDFEVNAAAFFNVMAMSLWIESPIIDLLATSTTLARSRQSYCILRQYTLWLMILVTVVHGLVALTPLYWPVVRGVLHLPEEVAQAARIPMMIMIPWSASIGWRRFLQGVLIRHGRTRVIGWGTALRGATMLSVGTALGTWSRLSGIEVAAVALACSVIAEAGFIHLIARNTVRQQFSSTTQDGDEVPLTAKKLIRFHFPLVLTTMVMMLGSPAVAAALNRTSDPLLATDGWQVATTLLFLFRTITFALPEVVISLYHDEASVARLRTFCVWVGLFASGMLLIMCGLSLDVWFFVRILEAESSVSQVAHVSLFAGASLPFIGALQSYIRGMLTAHHLTFARLVSIAVSMVLLIAMLMSTVAAGIGFQWIAPFALTASLVAELGVLYWLWRRSASVRAAKAAAA